ncbi:MAG: hypothetical protein QOE83_1053 [Actinomycetota bacterium]|jgi:PAS domain S-box-containing protein|nr:hypothetical protein [Actinomycetota bacterium]
MAGPVEGGEAGEALASRPHPQRDQAVRSGAELDMLHSLAAKLNSLSDVGEIGNAITGELHTIIDYHNCRVYLLQTDGITLLPVAFHGTLFSEYERESVEDLVTLMGEGITGQVAERRESLLTADARLIDYSVVIEGTEDILESMLAVPMTAGDKLVGVIVLSSLGFGKFDENDQRLLEVLASQAAVAFENAKLFQAEREAAETSAALLRLSQALTGMSSPVDILTEALTTVSTLVPSDTLAAYTRDESTGDFRAKSILSDDETAKPLGEIGAVSAELATAMMVSDVEPFIIPKDLVAQVPPEHWILPDARETMVAPLHWEPDGFGALILIARSPDATFSPADLRLARGVADTASLALGNARRITELERFHELVESLDAIFWEADPATLAFRFVGGRVDALLGSGALGTDLEERAWGDHIADQDRAGARLALLGSVAEVSDLSLEYRARAKDGTVRWMRDLIHPVRAPQGGTRLLRGLMVDITERKTAEQALRRSERKYSEAFRREKEASERLRNLDEMKNTFLEAVSHDLRTPLTAILGSALTLEQAGPDLTRDDTDDLIRRIAMNARKLERLLSDLLDLDRLQRGIVSPQLRPTDVRELVERCVAELEIPEGRKLELDVRPVTVSIDGAKVERIIENLLSNALRHTPPGAHIWLTAEAKDGGVLFTVEDDGPGVPDDLRDAVFEPFRQVPGSAAGHSPGVGVGLSLVLRFAELHGGRAWLDERPGGGAAFHVFLPGG